jgi:hypothetical protein
MLKDANFSSGSVTAYAYASSSPAPVPNNAGWTQCSISTFNGTTNTASGITFTGGINGSGSFNGATPYPAPVYSSVPETPVPGSTPLAVDVAVGNPAPVGSASPWPTQSTAPASGSNAYVGQIGGWFTSYNSDDWGYSGLCQAVTIPANGANLSGYVFEASDESTPYAVDVIAVLDTTGKNMLGLLWMENEVSTTASSAEYTDTAFRQIPGGGQTLDLSAYKGTTVVLFVGFWGGSVGHKGAYSDYWWLTNFQMYPGAGTYTTSKNRANLMNQRTRTR